MVGIDEVGRGCLAGPLLVVAARQHSQLPTVNDSKLLSKARREEAYLLLLRVCNFGEGWVTPTEIDQLGLTKATKLGVARALKDLSVPTTEEIIIDGNYNYLPVSYKNFECVIGADKSIPTVSAASIHAKVKRDRYMQGLAKVHSGYHFENHVGYATPAHYEALKNLGPIQLIHRASFTLARQKP